MKIFGVLSGVALTAITLLLAVNGCSSANFDVASTASVPSEICNDIRVKRLSSQCTVQMLPYSSANEPKGRIPVVHVGILTQISHDVIANKERQYVLLEDGQLVLVGEDFSNDAITIGYIRALLVPKSDTAALNWGIMRNGLLSEFFRAEVRIKPDGEVCVVRVMKWPFGGSVSSCSNSGWHNDLRYGNQARSLEDAFNAAREAFSNEGFTEQQLERNVGNTQWVDLINLKGVRYYEIERCSSSGQPIYTFRYPVASGPSSISRGEIRC